MFNSKKKKRSQVNLVDDTKSVVYDFRLRSSIIGFESYRAVEYRLYHKLAEDEMLPVLDKQLSKLLAGDVDAGNGNMLDCTIMGVYREAVSDLRRQHNDHSDLLRRLIIRRKADREDILELYRQREEELHTLQDEYDTTCKILVNQNSNHSKED